MGVRHPFNGRLTTPASHREQRRHCSPKVHSPIEHCGENRHGY